LRIGSLSRVNYEYERAYEYHTADAHRRQYVPDLFYPDIQLYHEHFALNHKSRSKCLHRATGATGERQWAASSRHLPSVLTPQPERPVRQYPPRFLADGRRKTQAVFHAFGQKIDSPARPVGYHAYPLRSSSL
jgi:hypothetical protein